MLSLTEIMNLSGSDKGNSIGAMHNYTPIYEKYFEPYRDSEIIFMEVGIDFGQSLRGWHSYFSKAQIYMVDINNFSQLNNTRVTCLQANQSSKEQISNVAKTVQSVDFFIDDGGHCMDHQQLTFAEIFPSIKSGGLFFIEDIVTSNWTHQDHCYGQSLQINSDRSNTTIRVFKDFQKTGIFKSQFLTDIQNETLTNMIENVIIYDDNNNEIPVDSDLENSIIGGGVILIKKR